LLRQFGGTSAGSILLAVLISSSALAGNEQQAALSVNPRAVEFELPDAGEEISGYRVELFPSRADTKTALAVNALEVARAAASESRGLVRIEMSKLFANVPDGEYVVTLQTLGPNGPSLRSEPAGPFQLTGHFRGGPRPAPAGDAGQKSGSNEAPPDHERGGRFWTIVGIALGVAAIVAPLILK